MNIYAIPTCVVIGGGSRAVGRLETRNIQTRQQHKSVSSQGGVQTLTREQKFAGPLAQSALDPSISHVPSAVLAMPNIYRQSIENPSGVGEPQLDPKPKPMPKRKPNFNLPATPSPNPTKIHRTDIENQSDGHQTKRYGSFNNNRSSIQ